MARTGEVELHRRRGLAIVRAYPDVVALMRPHRATAGWIACLVAFQVIFAGWIGGQPWWAVLAAAYSVGAVASLALWALLHETTHDLVFRRRNANRWLGIASGLPLAIPAAASFRRFHLLHHAHLGDDLLDGDHASAWEARLVGNGPLRKALWLLFQPLLLSLRAGRTPGVKLVDRWMMTNVAVQLAFDAAVIVGFGWGAFAYLLLGNVFALGLHPLGGRWIQEHHLVAPDQPTYSYYGPMNRLAFNCGHHCEHHDLLSVPWVHLPAVRRMASEFYDTLHDHHSWTAVLLHFLFDRQMTLTNRTFATPRLSLASLARKQPA
jgi:sphingolipid delta-4 desaturase